MSSLKSNPKFIIAVGIVALTGAMALYGCASDETASTPVEVAPATQPAFALWGPSPKKSGAQLWSETCMRCHNARPPGTYSDAQWQTVVHHMRLRANLTGEETREITAFLQASN